jgi:hypothetical protein
MNYGDEKLPEAFWRSVAPEPNTGCWLWTARLHGTGRSSVTEHGRVRYGHHLTFEAMHGRVPEGHDLMRLCPVLCCVNPTHYCAMTRRAINRTKLGQQTRCKNGHEFTPENTYVRYGGGRSCRACHVARRNRPLSAAKKRRRRETGREARLWARYGLTLSAFEAMRAAQDGLCAICRDPFVETPHVDHDHATGKVRALLCLLCNAALGSLKDDITRAQGVVDYLRAHAPAEAGR